VATVPTETIVPGDIVVVRAGERIPADLRLLDDAGLRVDESALTGEAVPVDKHAGPGMAPSVP
jgi:Ca2+-transporting ATPase